MPLLVDPVIAPEQFSNAEQPTLHAGAIVLRPWGEDDAAAVVAAYQEPEIQRWHVRSMTCTEAEEWIEAAGRSWSNGAGASWAVEHEGVFAGRMTLKFYLDDAHAGVGYWTRRAARGRG